MESKYSTQGDKDASLLRKKAQELVNKYAQEITLWLNTPQKDNKKASSSISYFENEIANIEANNKKKIEAFIKKTEADSEQYRTYLQSQLNAAKEKYRLTAKTPKPKSVANIELAYTNIKQQWDRTIYTKFPFTLTFVDDIEQFKPSPITPEKEEVAKAVTLAPPVCDVKEEDEVIVHDVKPVIKKEVKLLVAKPKPVEVEEAVEQIIKTPEQPSMKLPVTSNIQSILNSILKVEETKPKFFDSMGVPCSEQEYEEEQESIRMRRDCKRAERERDREEEDRKLELRRMWEIERKVQNEQDQYRQRQQRLDELEELSKLPPPITQIKKPGVKVLRPASIICSNVNSYSVPKINDE